jgi:hypothetical protein
MYYLNAITKKKKKKAKAPKGPTPEQVMALMSSSSHETVHEQKTSPMTWALVLGVGGLIAYGVYKGRKG